MVYYINDNGVLCAVGNSAEKRKSFCLDNFGDMCSVYIHNMRDGYKLIVNSFKNIIAVIKTEECGDYLSLSKTELNFLQNLFNTKINEDEPSKKHYEPLSRVLDFGICFSYACNMRCTYCYQQDSETLNRRQMSHEDLRKILALIKERSVRENRGVCIELFGGEPLIFPNINLVKEVLQFARENRYSIAVITNGAGILDYKREFAIYRGYIKRVATTLDGGQQLHDSRRVFANKSGSFQKIIDGINFLADIGIHTSVIINFDYSNMCELENFLNIARKNGWDKNERMELAFSRVDDRFLNTDRVYMSESELLCNILKYKDSLPKNTKFAFLNAILPICKKIGVNFEQSGNRREFGRYCWATSHIDSMVYFDAMSQAYRCTFTVGRPEYSIGTVDDTKSVEKGIKAWAEHNILRIDKCKKCVIGGYCSGGCRISHMSNPDRQCAEELQNFSHFVDNILEPHVTNQIVSL